MASDEALFLNFPESWLIKRIGDIAKVKGGKRLPKGMSLTKKPTSHPYLRVVDFQDGSIDESNLLYVPGEVFPKIKRYTISSKDIFISIAGTIGISGKVSDKLNGANLTENAAKICEIEPFVDRDYLLAFLRSQWGKYQIYAQTVGSTQPKLALFRIEEIEFPLPSLQEQRAIAHILGTLDDKIELNRQMNETLEAMARAIFKSWFVDFDPVRAKAEGRDTGLPEEIADLFPGSFQDSELGPIPKGWNLVKLPEIIDINPQRSLAKDTIAPYLDMKNMPTNLARVKEWIYREFKSGSKFMNGDTLVARITPCLENGKTAFVDFLNNEQVGWGSTEYIILRSKPPLSPGYSYLLARSPTFRMHAITNMTGSSGRQRVPTSCFDDFNIVVPTLEVANCLGDFFDKVLLLMKYYDDASATITEIRDTLLPKLISGEISVPDAEKFIKE